MGGLLALYGAWIDATMDAGDTWTNPKPLALVLFAGACVVAAGLAVVPGGSVQAHGLGVLVFAVAVYLIAEDPSDMHPAWSSPGLVSGVVIAAGLIASGLPQRGISAAN